MPTVNDSMDVDIAELDALLRVRDGIYADDLLLAAIVRLDLLTVLAQEPATLDELCRRAGIAYRPADVLCTLLRAMRLLHPGPVLRPTALARSCLVRGAPYDIRPYLASGASRSTCLEQAELLRTGQPAAWTGGRAGVWPHDPAFGEQLTDANAARARVLAPALARVLGEVPIRAALEIGGPGVTVAELAARRSGVNVATLDTADMFGQLPLGYDLHVLPDVLHCWSEPQVRKIVGRCYDTLAPGGRLIDVDSHLNADKAGPLAVARYSALLLYATEGQCWAVTEIEEFLADAGFVHIEVRPVTVDRTAVLAQKPAA